MKNNYNLPDFCFANDNLDESKIIILKYGESGYYPTEYTGDAMVYNGQIGVTKYEMEAMSAGSMFGWDVPLANPEKWKEIYSKKEAQENK